MAVYSRTRYLRCVKGIPCSRNVTGFWGIEGKADVSFFLAFSNCNEAGRRELKAARAWKLQEWRLSLMRRFLTVVLILVAVITTKSFAAPSITSLSPTSG